MKNPLGGNLRLTMTSNSRKLTSSDLQPAVTVEPADLDDVALILDLTRSAHAEYEGVLVPSPGALEESGDDIGRALVEGGAAIARVGETAVGTIRYRQGDGFLQIGRLLVLPQYRFVRVGTSLVTYTEQFARLHDVPALRAEVRESLPGVLTFFQINAFEQIAETRHPRDAGQQVAILAKSLR